MEVLFGVVLIGLGVPAAIVGWQRFLGRRRAHRRAAAIRAAVVSMTPQFQALAAAMGEQLVPAFRHAGEAIRGLGVALSAAFEERDGR